MKNDNMQCTNKFTVNGNIVPCGYCLACRINRVTVWTFRMLCEMSDWEHYTFATITYDDINIPLIQNLPTLNKDDIIKFHKRLRYHGHEFKYYLVGEYGDETRRPHYHGIYYGLGKKDKLEMQHHWNMGNIYHERVIDGTIKYVAKYIMSKTRESDYDPVQPPFALISNGIGKNYWKYGLEKKNIDQIMEDGYFINHKGIRSAIPKFIKELYKEEFKDLSMFKKEQQLVLKALAASNDNPNDPFKLYYKKKAKEAQVRGLQQKWRQQNKRNKI